MYVVIPVADEPRNDTLALAVASIHQHTPYDVLTIGKDFGHTPHIDINQRVGRVFENTDNAMRTACLELNEPFIWSADDIYWTRPAEPPRWALGRLADTDSRGIYGRRKRATLQWLQQQRKPTWDYEAHVPMLIDPSPMLYAIAVIETNNMLDKRTLYGNLTGEPDIIAPDVKIRPNHQPPRDSPWISSSNGHLP